MKKQLLIGTVLLATISAYSQSGKIKPSGGQLVNMKEVAKNKFEHPNEGQSTNAMPGAGAESESKEAITNTWNNFTASMNIYGVSISFTKPLQWNDDLNAVSFIHRKSPTYLVSPTPASAAETGAIVAQISTDCGVTWDSTAIFSNDNFWARYPNGAIYNPPSVPTNTEISNAYVVGCGPTTGAGNVTWIGNWYASKPLGVINYDNAPSTVPNAQQVVATAGPFPPGMSRHDFAAYNFCATDDGMMRILAGVTNDATESDTAVALVKGVFNANDGVFDWTDTVFNPPTVMASDGTEQWLSRPMMAWNEAGTVGYIVIIGARQGATGSNVGFQPIVYKTTNSGASWTLDPNGIDFNDPAYADVLRPIITVNEDSTLEVPFFMWTEGMDVAVDMNNKLHIFSTIVGTASNHPDSLAFITSFTAERYRWPHTKGFRPFLYDFIYDGTNWSHLTVDSMPTEGPGQLSTDAGYGDNPWDPDPSNSNQKIRLAARLQLSRTPDGKYIVYNWTESDTTLVTNYRKWNIYPNVKSRVYDASTGTIHPVELNVTNPATGPTAPNSVKNRAMFMHVSPKCRLSSTVTANGPVISVPITVSNSSPYSQLSKNNHWFSWATLNFGNVPDASINLCGVATPTTPTDTTGIAENAYNSAMNSHVFPNPARNNAVVKVNLVNSSKIVVELVNTLGQVMNTVSVEGQNGPNSIPVNLSGMSSGIYFVNVKVGEAVGTKKLIVE